MKHQPICPARAYLRAAEADNAALGHENRGFLSAAHGFLPSRPPSTSLPDSHRAWDELASELPDLWRTLRLRSQVLALPMLEATPAALADEHLLRASTVLALLAHSYWWLDPAEPDALPACLAHPWRQVNARLLRPSPVLSYIDLVAHNWRIRDPNGPTVVENLDLLVPTVGTEEERIFYMTHVEFIAASTPALAALLDGQEAVLADDVEGLERALIQMRATMQYLTHHCFQKISLNAHHDLYVDPVVWGRSVAPTGIPIGGGRLAADGAAIPVFHTFDAFFGRSATAGRVARTARDIAASTPPHWRQFPATVAQVSIRDFVAQKRMRNLKGLFLATLDDYAGDKGLIGAHRLKAYGYLETSFKAGRTMTGSGFGGRFRDRAWEVADAALEEARVERHVGLAEHAPCAHVRPSHKDEDHDFNDPHVLHLELDVRDQGVRYAPGDWVGVLPENSSALVARTLQALSATGDERVRLDKPWRDAVAHRLGERDVETLPLRTLLQLGRLRPVARSVAKRLLAVSASHQLARAIARCEEEKWELWDLLDLLASTGFNTRRLWRAEPWESESICKVVTPERYRLFSIASAMSDPDATNASRVRLAVAKLNYRSEHARTGALVERYGAVGTMLAERARDPDAPPIQFQIIPSPGFRLPADPRTPIVMFAGGAGVAPFMGFLEDRARTPDAGPAWLFLGLRSRASLHPVFASLVQQGQLELRVGLSRDDVIPRVEDGRYVFARGMRRRVDTLIVEEAEALWTLLSTGAHVFICGRTPFARTVIDGLRGVIRAHIDAPDPDAAARTFYYRLNASGRLHQDIFTTHSGFSRPGASLYNVSELVMRNHASHGFWMAISGKVYDMAEFLHLHPGGAHIVQAYCGMDGTHAYRAVQHHLNPEVDSLLGLYELGQMRRLSFGGAWGIGVGDRGLRYIDLDSLFREWVRYIYAIVEMENALRNDYTVLHKPTVRGDPEGELTPFKVQLVAGTHDRFINDFFHSLLGDDTRSLWSSTLAMTVPDEGFDHVYWKLETLRTSPEANQVAGLTEVLLAASRSGQVDDRVVALCSAVQTEDERFLVQLKQCIRDAIEVFEVHGAETLTRGRVALAHAVRKVPQVVQDYLHRLTA